MDATYWKVLVDIANTVTFIIVGFIIFIHKDDDQ